MDVTILDLPNELLLSIADAVDDICDLAALVRTTWRLYQVLNDYLYRKDAEMDGGTALLWAAQTGVLRTAQLSLAQEPDIETTVRFSTPHELAVSGLFRPLAMLHESRMTPLQIAVCLGSEAVASLLIESGAQFARPFPRAMDRCSALHVASAMGLSSVVRLLVRKGADLEARDPRHQTPLHYALRRVDDESLWLRQGVTVAWLLELGADPEARNLAGVKPRMLAESSPNPMMERVLTKGFRSFVLNIPVFELCEMASPMRNQPRNEKMAVIEYGYMDTKKISSPSMANKIAPRP